ncbi:MAG: hypothetical protein ABIH92_00920 [Nanoarchaeota archaeon]
MKKSEIFVIFLLVIVSLAITHFYVPERVSLAPSDYFPPIPQDCSNESIEAVWDVVFEPSTVTSEDLIFFVDDSAQDRCDDFIAYKTDGTVLYYLWGDHYIIEGRSRSSGGFLEYYYDFEMKEFIGAYINYTQDYFDNVLMPELALADTHNDVFNVLEDSFEEANWSLVIRNFSLINASEHFDEIFQYVPEESWSSDSSSMFGDYYSFFEQEGDYPPHNNETYGWVVVNYSYSFMGYRQRDEYNIVYCQSNWTPENGTCEEGDEFVIWYRDLNGCANATDRPANGTGYCDYDGNNIIGTAGDIDDDHWDADVYIDDEEINYSIDYSTLEEELVELYDDDENVVRVEFDHDFTLGPLNLKIMRIEIQDDNDDFGYIVVEGIDVEKIVRVDKLGDREAICVEDREVDDIEDIDEDCDGTAEHYIGCPGEDEDEEFECDIDGDVYVVSGLTDSGVRELLSVPAAVCDSSHLSLCTTQGTCIDAGGYWYDNTCNANQNPTCTSSWSCGDWGGCVNGVRTKVCTDANGCEVDYEETETCTTTTGCTPNWDCTEWGDCEDEEQTRECDDLNNCESSSNPVTLRDCESSFLSRNMVIILVIAVLVVLILVIVVVIIKAIQNRRDKDGQDVVKSNPIRVVQRQPRGFYQGSHYGRGGGSASGDYGRGGGGAGGSYGNRRR